MVRHSSLMDKGGLRHEHLPYQRLQPEERWRAASGGFHLSATAQVSRAFLFRVAVVTARCNAAGDGGRGEREVRDLRPEGRLAVAAAGTKQVPGRAGGGEPCRCCADGVRTIKMEAKGAASVRVRKGTTFKP